MTCETRKSMVNPTVDLTGLGNIPCSEAPFYGLVSTSHQVMRALVQRMAYFIDGFKICMDCDGTGEGWA